MSTPRKIKFDHTAQSPENQQALDELCEDYKDIISLHPGGTGYTKWLT